MDLAAANPLTSSACSIEDILCSLRAHSARDLKRLMLPRTQCAHRTFYRNAKLVFEVFRHMESRGLAIPPHCKTETLALEGVKGLHTFRAFVLTAMPSGVTYSLGVTNAGVVVIASCGESRSVLYIFSSVGCTMPVHSEVPSPAVITEFNNSVLPWFNSFCDGVRFQVLECAPRVVQLITGGALKGIYKDANVSEVEFDTSGRCDDRVAPR